jgi:hypothetical protein
MPPRSLIPSLPDRQVVLSQSFALWAVAVIIVVVAILSVIIWRMSVKREVHRRERGDLVRECAKCGTRLRPDMANCPKCGADSNSLIA